MHDTERRIPSPAQRAELAVVLLVAFASPVLGSLAALAARGARPPITEAGLLATVAMEVVLLALLGLLLRARGWTRETLGLAPHAGDVPWGLALVVGCWLFGVLGWVAASAATGTAPTPGTLVEGRLPWATVALMSAVNPVFEEVFACGYLVAVLKPWKGAAFAVNASTALRLSYHLYQGPQAVTVIPVGLLFGAWFARTGRLWPVIVAHAVLDFVALAAVGRWA